VFSALCVLWVGSQFFATLKWQVFLAQARGGTLDAGQLWSAPLDDVFIHFDFARSAARGFPFEWSEGNGYSSGGTSLLYPFVLALGYRAGYLGLDLMLWAGIVATTSTWALLLWARVLFRRLPIATVALLPPLLLSVGALNWTLFSGMEVAFFLAIWAACVVAWSQVVADASRTNTCLLGVACALLVATRPESAVVVAVFTLSALTLTWKRCDWKSRAELLLVTALPGALVIVAHAIANRLFTGDWSAAGALVKLEMNHPYMTAQEVWDAWKFHMGYQALRVTDYHFSELKIPLWGFSVSAGWLVWLLAATPFAFKQTRREGLLLWLCIFAWVAVVALNGQVRWQNERYTMPAVAWLLIAAALGLGAIFARMGGAINAVRYQRGRCGPLAAWGAVTTASVIATLVFVVFLEGRFRDQLWFFGRASRNIFEQHIAAAATIRHLPTHRVLVGDAGAIPYVADTPALDLIGLGGFHDYPFARATRMGVGAGLELVQRMPADQRPNLMAIYPSWWGDLPGWFGDKVADFKVRGNVICGGASKVLYRPEWQALDNSRTPFDIAPTTQLVAELDVADLISEQESGFELIGAPGFIGMKMLGHPTSVEEDAWDAGRVLPAGSISRFELRGLVPNTPATLLLRAAPEVEASVNVRVGDFVHAVELTPTDGWVEAPIAVPAGVVGSTVVVHIEVTGGEFMLYHVWAVQPR
jgi:hypothetical protein